MSRKKKKRAICNTMDWQLYRTKRRMSVIVDALNPCNMQTIWLWYCRQYRTRYCIYWWHKLLHLYNMEIYMIHT